MTGNVYLDIQGLTNEVQVAPEYTDASVNGYYSSLLIALNSAIIQYGADKTGNPGNVQTDLNNITSNMQQLLALAQNGMADPANPSGPPIELTLQMASLINIINSSFQLSGITITPTSSNITSALIDTWLASTSGQALTQAVTDPNNPSGPTVTQIEASTDIAVLGNRTLQALIQSEFIDTGNTMISNEMSNLQTALQQTQNALTTLNSIQGIMNDISAPPASGGNLATEFPNQSSFDSATQQAFGNSLPPTPNYISGTTTQMQQLENYRDELVQAYAMIQGNGTKVSSANPAGGINPIDGTSPDFGSSLQGTIQTVITDINSYIGYAGSAAMASPISTVNPPINPVYTSLDQAPPGTPLADISTVAAQPLNVEDAQAQKYVGVIGSDVTLGNTSTITGTVPSGPSAGQAYSIQTGAASYAASGAVVDADSNSTTATINYVTINSPTGESPLGSVAGTSVNASNLGIPLFIKPNVDGTFDLTDLITNNTGSPNFYIPSSYSMVPVYNSGVQIGWAATNADGTPLTAPSGTVFVGYAVDVPTGATVIESPYLGQTILESNIPAANLNSAISDTSFYFQPNVGLYNPYVPIATNPNSATDPPVSVKVSFPISGFQTYNDIQNMTTLNKSQANSNLFLTDAVDSAGNHIAVKLGYLTTQKDSTTNYFATGANPLLGFSRQSVFGYILDNQDVNNSINGSKTGANENDLSIAVTAGQNLNSSQNQDLQQFLFVFQEFYQAASAILTTLEQMVQQFTQGMRGS